jgi:glycosyltransferase involved in cell wall biosynthesis
MSGGPHSPFVSVVVPTWNRAALLSDCLASLRRQDYPQDRFEILVVDDGSTDSTSEVVRRLRLQPGPEIRYVHQAHGGLNVARNAGIAASRGDPICFVDDEADVPSGWLQALVGGALRHPEAGCLGGPIRVQFGATPPRICEMESWADEGEMDFGPSEKTVAFVNGGNLSVRRWALARVGLFHRALSGPGDESEWQNRLAQAGIAIVYVPSAWLWHRRTASDLQWNRLLKRRFRRGIGYAAYARFMGEEVSIGKVLRPIPFYLFHAMRRLCFGALMEVAWKLGLVWGTMRRRGGPPGST